MGNNSSRRFQDEYKQGAMVGKGGFAVVHVAVKRSDPTVVVAAKLIKPEHLSKSMLKDQVEEVEIMRKLNHPNIVKLHDVFSSRKRLVIVMEFCSGGQLLKRIVKMHHKDGGPGYTEAVAANVIRQIASAVQHMHNQGIVHRDLKPENILYANEGRNSAIKITDFGLSKVLRGKQRMKMPCGTPNYVAPEVVDSKTKTYTNKCDMWSVGVIMYVLVSGYPPFYGTTLKSLFHRILACKYDFNPTASKGLPNPFDDVSDEVKQIIKELLVLDPKERLSATQLLKKPWVSGKSQRKPSRELRRASMAITKYHNKKRFQQAVELLFTLDVLYQVAKGEKRFVMVCGQRQYEDAKDCVKRRRSGNMSDSKRRRLNAAPKEGVANKYVSAHRGTAGGAEEYTRSRRPHGRAGTADATLLCTPDGSAAGTATGIQGPNRAGMAGKAAGRRQRRMARSFVNIDMQQAGSSI